MARKESRSKKGRGTEIVADIDKTLEIRVAKVVKMSLEDRLSQTERSMFRVAQTIVTGLLALTFVLEAVTHLSGLVAALLKAIFGR